MKLEVGMFVRTNHRNEHVIRKIVNIFEDSLEKDHHIVFDKPTKYQYFVEDDNYEASYKILDLIKIGDVLHCKNDNEYWTVQETQETGYIQTEWVIVEMEEEFFEKFDEIITKEQAKEFSYKIGE